MSPRCHQAMSPKRCHQGNQGSPQYGRSVFDLLNLSSPNTRGEGVSPTLVTSSGDIGAVMIGPWLGAARLGTFLGRVLPLGVTLALLVVFALGWTALWVWFFQRAYQANTASAWT